MHHFLTHMSIAPFTTPFLSASRAPSVVGVCAWVGVRPAHAGAYPSLSPPFTSLRSPIVSTSLGRVDAGVCAGRMGGTYVRHICVGGYVWGVCAVSGSSTLSPHYPVHSTIVAFPCLLPPACGVSEQCGEQCGEQYGRCVCVFVRFGRPVLCQAPLRHPF